MKLIVIEGLDGAGKSTQISMLTKWFEENSLNCRYLHFPRTDAPFFGELVARFLRGEFGQLNQVDPYLVAMLYAGDRKDAAKIISDWIKDGFYVILDRYTYSNVAYQCAKLKNPCEIEKLKEWILELEFNYFGIPRPDINIFLDVPLGFIKEKLTDKREGDDRSYLHGSRDIHESSLDFQCNVRNVYLSVAEKDENLQVIDCNSATGTMLNQHEIFRLVINRLKEKKIV